MQLVPHVLFSLDKENKDGNIDQISQCCESKRLLEIAKVLFAHSTDTEHCSYPVSDQLWMESFSYTLFLL